MGLFAKYADPRLPQAGAERRVERVAATRLTGSTSSTPGRSASSMTVLARALGAPLDVIVVCKLGAVPARTRDGRGRGRRGQVINREVVRLARVPASELAAVQAHGQAQVDARAARYRARRRREPLAGRTAVVVRRTPGLARTCSLTPVRRPAAISGSPGRSDERRGERGELRFDGDQPSGRDAGTTCRCGRVRTRRSGPTVRGCRGVPASPH